MCKNRDLTCGTIRKTMIQAQEEPTASSGVGSERCLELQMKPEQLDQYKRQIDVEFRGDKYLVRDNGAAYRMHKPGRRRSSFDETWTFGRHEESSGYMFIGSHLIHRIVAFAFLGSPPSDKHVVDHIDMDRKNNRPENLRWVTRLDNVIRHPSTRRQIIGAYGSLDSFFENPGAAAELDQGSDWLRTVSKEEAERSRNQLLLWAESDGRPKDRILGNRVYGKPDPTPPPPEPIPDKQSLTPAAVQRRWKTPTEFPSCPEILGADPLAEYASNLRSGAIFSRDRYKECLVVTAERGDSLLSVLVESKEKDAIKPWAVAMVTIEDGKFVHEAVGTFFELNGAKKAYYHLLGIPFAADSIDDYS